MKKVLLALFILFLFLFCGNLFAAGTVTINPVQKYYIQGEGWRATIKIDWVADSAAGTLPTATIPIMADQLKGWYLYMVETDPGSVAPTSYAVTATDSHGLDLFGGLLASCSTTTTQIFCIGTAIPGFPVMTENLTLAIVQSGSPVNSATGTIILTFTAN